MDKKLLDILVCPICKGPLIYKKEEQELIEKYKPSKGDPTSKLFECKWFQRNQCFYLNPLYCSQKDSMGNALACPRMKQQDLKK